MILLHHSRSLVTSSSFLFLKHHHSLFSVTLPMKINVFHPSSSDILQPNYRRILSQTRVRRHCLPILPSFPNIDVDESALHYEHLFWMYTLYSPRSFFLLLEHQFRGAEFVIQHTFSRLFSASSGLSLNNLISSRQSAVLRLKRISFSCANPYRMLTFINTTRTVHVLLLLFPKRQFHKTEFIVLHLFFQTVRFSASADLTPNNVVSCKQSAVLHHK